MPSRGGHSRAESAVPNAGRRGDRGRTRPPRRPPLHRGERTAAPAPTNCGPRRRRDSGSATAGGFGATATIGGVGTATTVGLGGSGTIGGSSATGTIGVLVDERLRAL